MKRVIVFLVVGLLAVASLAAVVVWYLGSYQRSGGSMSGLMGQMMGNGYANGMTQPMPESVWVILAALLAAVAIGIGGAAYYATYPEIKTQASGKSATTMASPPNEEVAWPVLVRTSKPDEKKVLEVLAVHDGSYLQKFVVKEAGLSKLKTHRIVSRLAERGIVTVEKSGNTNQVSLAPWIREEAVRHSSRSVSSGA